MVNADLSVGLPVRTPYFGATSLILRDGVVVSHSYSKDEAIVRDLVQLRDAGVVGTEEQEPLACVRRAVWGVLYADDAGIVSKPAEELAEMMAVIGPVFGAAGSTASENKTKTMLLQTPDQTTLAPPFVIEAAGQS